MGPDPSAQCSGQFRCGFVYCAQFRYRTSKMEKMENIMRLEDLALFSG